MRTVPWAFASGPLDEIRTVGCKGCAFYAPNTDLVAVPGPEVIAVRPGGECRRHAPRGAGFASVVEADWCGEQVPIPPPAEPRPAPATKVTVIPEYLGVGHEQASREAKRLLERAVRIGHWFDLPEILATLRLAMRSAPELKPEPRRPYLGLD